MAKNKIQIKSYLGIRDEKVPAAAITPGHLIERTSADKVQKHSTAGGQVFPMFALENAEEGDGITDDYGTSDVCQCWIPTRGDRVYAHISSSSEDIARGNFLESAGDGTLRKYDIASSGGVIEGDAVIVGVAVEAITAGNQGVIEVY